MYNGIRMAWEEDKTVTITIVQDQMSKAEAYCREAGAIYSFGKCEY